jgi:hypothetical protein
VTFSFPTPRPLTTYTPVSDTELKEGRLLLYTSLTSEKSNALHARQRPRRVGPTLTPPGPGSSMISAHAPYLSQR